MAVAVQGRVNNTTQAIKLRLKRQKSTDDDQGQCEMESSEGDWH